MDRKPPVGHGELCADSTVPGAPLGKGRIARLMLSVPHLPGCLLHEALVGDAEGSAQSLGWVVLEHLLVDHVHVQVDGGIDGSIHSSMTIKHCKISLFFLVLPVETQGGKNSGESNTNSSLDCLKAVNLGFVLSSLNCN